MPLDVVTAMLEERVVSVGSPTQVGVRRGWAIARHMVQVRVPMWCVAAGVASPPSMPPVDGFGDLPAIHEALRALPVEAALHVDPGARAEGLQLAQASLIPPLRGVETALGHARYPKDQEGLLCAVTMELERVQAMLGALAVVRHREIGVGEFDLGPWTVATDALGNSLVSV